MEAIWEAKAIWEKWSDRGWLNIRIEHLLHFKSWQVKPSCSANGEEQEDQEGATRRKIEEDQERRETEDTGWQTLTFTSKMT